SNYFFAGFDQILNICICRIIITVGNNNPIYIWIINGLSDVIMEFSCITISRKSIDGKTERFTFFFRPGEELCGMIISTYFADDHDFYWIATGKSFRNPFQFSAAFFLTALFVTPSSFS